ncbi:DNRLRE domain-containing protein [Clostridium gasigenes]|uniref:DNRLRE domain-containing protein n=1 Tax=Clostridium gasigenes TaxID=94869 RepID=UPI0016296E0B|nr:DNRLRE domain-containing protein [Clostridium gasigenes]MBB6625329.1 DNRLRE domain-containing protein [Clostridium gasigenes]
MPKRTIIYPSKDTVISSANNCKHLNFGKYSSLYINTEYTSLLFFDLSSIPENAVITSAKLNLYLYRFYPNSTTNITIKQLNDPFYENIVTFVTKPSSSNLLEEDTKFKEIAFNDIGQFITFVNLTNTVSSWHANKTPNYGFELSASTDSLLSFFSKDYTENELRANLEVEYTIATIHPLKIITTSQSISPKDDSSIETNIFNISNSLFFNYLIDNSIINQDSKICEFICVSVKACATKNGIFEKVGNEIFISPNTIYSLPISPINKFIKLSINGSSYTSVNVTSILKFFDTPDSPPRVSYSKIVGDKIILTMTKPLIESAADTNAFTINSDSEITVIDILILGTTVTLTCSTISGDCRFNQSDPNFLTYIANNNTNLRSITAGDVDDFYDQMLTLDTPNIEMYPENYDLSNSEFETTIYKLSKFTSLRYDMNFRSRRRDATCKVTIQGSLLKNGPFYKINETTISNRDSLNVPLETNYNYVCLLIKGEKFNPGDVLSLSPYASAYSNDVPSILESIKSIDSGANIKISLTQPVTLVDSTDTIFDVSVFTINPSSLAINVKDVNLLDNIITLILTDAIAPNILATLTYKGTDTSYITSKNGDIYNFTNVSILTP